MKLIFQIIFYILLAGSAFAGSSTLRGIDTITASGGSPLTVPTSGGTLLGTTSNIPVAGSMVQEIPSGTCNGSTTAFTLANTPGGSSSVLLTLDGSLMTQGSGKDYTISGSSITLGTACATGQILWASYSKY